MYVKIDGQEWKLDFQYTEEVSFDEEFYGEAKRITHCFFEKSQDDVSSGYARATCHPFDHFCKTIGRKLALTRVLEQVFPTSVSENKNRRKQVWEQYWATVKK